MITHQDPRKCPMPNTFSCLFMISRIAGHKKIEMPRNNFYGYFTKVIATGFKQLGLNISPVNSQLFQLYIPVIKSTSASRIHCGRAALTEHYCAQYGRSPTSPLNRLSDTSAIFTGQQLLVKHFTLLADLCLGSTCRAVELRFTENYKLLF